MANVSAAVVEGICDTSDFCMHNHDMKNDINESNLAVHSVWVEDGRSNRVMSDDVSVDVSGNLKRSESPVDLPND